MNAQIALRHRPSVMRSPGRLVRGVSVAALLMVLSAGVLWACVQGAERVAEPPLAQQLVHWQDAKHDWLMVVDPATRELVVYDATDGRPLERLGTDDGLPDVQSIARQGSWLFVRGGRQPQMLWLKLPELRAVAVADR